MFRQIFAACALAICCAGTAQADIKEIHVPWNPVQHPDNPWAILGGFLDQCAKTEACRKTMDM